MRPRVSTYYSCFVRLIFLAFCLSTMVVLAQQSAPVYGIGGYDLASPADQVFAFDYNSSGKADHLVLYRPGTGTIWIVANNNGSFVPVYASGNGIGGYDLMSPNDRIFPLDYNSNGHLDHLVCYRPGAGVIYILANNGGTFSPIYASGSGIGGFDLMSTSDIGFAYDASGGGTYNSMIFYRPGTGVAFVLNNTIPITGGFTPTFISGYNGGGLGKFDLTSPADRLIPFNMPNETGANDLIGYRPGAHLASFIIGDTSSFNSLYLSTSGIGGFDLGSTADQMIPFDYSSTGKLDHLIVFRPGTGLAWILQFAGPVVSPTFFEPIFQSSYSSQLNSWTGIGGFDLRSSVDQMIGFDYNSTGHSDHLLLYRPGTGVVWIMENINGSFYPVYSSSYLPAGYPNVSASVMTDIVHESLNR